MIRGLLETRQLQHAIPHLREAEARDAQHLPFVRHDVSEQLHVPGIDVHVAHDDLDLADDDAARGLDAEHGCGLHDAVGGGVQAVDAVGGHARLQAVALDVEPVGLGLVVRLDDRARGVRVAADGDVREEALDGLGAQEGLGVLFGFEGRFGGFGARGGHGVDLDADELLEDAHVFGLDFEFLLLADGGCDVHGGDFEVEFVDGFEVDAEVNDHLGAGAEALDPMDDVSEVGLFDAAFGDFRARLALRVVELAGYEWCTDQLGGVDDFLDTWYTLCQAHTGHTGEVEGLECHLRAGLADGLSTYSSHCVSRLGLCTFMLLETGCDECCQSRFRELGYAVDGIFG